MALVPDMAARRASLSPHRLAFIDQETGTRWTFAAVDEAAGRLAAVLRGRGLEAGARVAILCLNRPEFFIALFACQKAGLILAPLNWRQPVAELLPVMDSVTVAALLHDATHAHTAAELARHRQTALPLLSLDDLPALTADSAPLPAVPVDEDAPWYLLFTSGTTGTPKAVIQTPRMAWANALNVAQSVDLVRDDRSVNFLPLFHTGGINLYTLPLFAWGGVSRVLRKFDADTLLSLIEAGEITQFFGVPAIYQAFRLHPRIDAVDFSRVRGFGCGGAALPEDVIGFFAERGAVVCNGYGMTETGPMGFLIDREAALTKIGSIGKPQLLTEARIAGAPPDGAAEGELEMRGPSITPGYYGNPHATAAAFTADGWLRSGDVAARDADGTYRIIDRIKDMYISGGENVYPAEVEKALMTHPDILEAAVIGIPDDRWGEVGAAYLILRPGRAADFDPAPLATWCRERLAAYKIPKTFQVVDDFPRTAAGKVRKPLLRKDNT